jgi:hypothetical protein
MLASLNFAAVESNTFATPPTWLSKSNRIMSGSHQRSESKRKLFRAITSRISLHNHAIHIPEREDLKDEPKDDVKEQSATITHITHRHTQIQSPPLLSYTGATNGHLIPNGNTQLNNHEHGSVDHNVHTQAQMVNTREVSSRQSDISSVPVTQGSEGNNFSYLESMKKAPIKKQSHTTPQHMVSPTNNSKVRNSRSHYAWHGSDMSNKGVSNEMPGISRRSFPESECRLGYDCYPVTETTNTSADMSYTNKSDTVIINEKNKEDMNEYDYKTFSTNHPLRLSKVKAFEQAELTTRLHFSKFDVGGDVSTDNGRRKTAKIQRSKTDYIYRDDIQRKHGQHGVYNENEYPIDTELTISSDVTDDEIIVQIPQLSQDESRSLLGYAPQRAFAGTTAGSSSRQHSDSFPIYGQTSVEKRILAMKSALRTLSHDDVVENRLGNSTLTETFQNTGEFLRVLEPQEVELWEAMNEDFEKEMQEMHEIRRMEKQERCKLVPEETIRAVSAALKHSKRMRHRNIAAETAVSSLLRKRIKEDLRAQTDGSLM